MKNLFSIQSSSFDSSFNFFANQNVVTEQSMTSFSVTESKSSAFAKDKPEGKENDSKRNNNRKDTKKDFQNKNFAFKKNEPRKPERERGQRKQEIVDTFFFL